jgi:hypothetical protein
MQAAFALVPSAEREAVRARAATTASDLLAWAAAAGADVDRGLADRLATVVAAIAPDLPASALAVLARYSLWTFLLDDELDDVSAEPAVLAALAERVDRRVNGDKSVAGGALDAMLADLVEALQATSADPAVLTRFAGSLCDAVHAGIEHTVRAQQIRHDRAPMPGVVEYLAVASRHINYRSFAYALMLLAIPGPAGRSLTLIDEALGAASRAVRLANDLRSVDADRAAGRLNVLLLPYHDGTPIDVAAVERRIGCDVRLHDRLLRDVPGAGVLRRSLRVATGIYRITDLR